LAFPDIAKGKMVKGKHWNAFRQVKLEEIQERIARDKYMMEREKGQGAVEGDA